MVEYGETPELGRKEGEARIGRRHAVALTGLDPGSTYHYRVEGVGGSSATGCFRTAPASDNSRFSFAVVGDSGSGGKGQLAVAALLERLRPDLVLHTGDVVYPAGQERHYDRRFFAPYRNLIKTVPLFPVLGNHEVRKGNGAAFLENFHPPLGSPGSTKRYYSFNWGNTHFVALDSELYHGDRGSNLEEQRDFLKRDLATTRKRWRIVFLHRSPYGSSRHGGDEKARENLEPLFVKHGGGPCLLWPRPCLRAHRAHKGCDLRGERGRRQEAVSSGQWRVDSLLRVSPPRGARARQRQTPVAGGSRSGRQGC